MAEIQNKQIRGYDIISADGGMMLGHAENDVVCDGCVFYQLLNSSSEQKCCHYLLYTGRMRPCGPGKACTVRRDADAGDC